MTLEENHPYVEGTLEVAGRAPLRGRFVIDTGSAAALLIAPEVAARESLASAFPRTLETLGRGVGGELRNRIGRAESFTLGELRFDRPLVALAQSSAGRISAPGTVGNIGGLLLGRCRVTFDYPRRCVRFERRAEFDLPFQADMSGASILRDSSGWSRAARESRDACVRSGSARRRRGDERGRRAGRAHEPAGAAHAHAERRPVRSVGIRRGTKEATLTLVLRRLI